MDNMVLDKYLLFRKLMDLLNDEYIITIANMRNYAGDIEIECINEVGVTINVRVTMKEAENNGN